MDPRAPRAASAAWAVILSVAVPLGGLGWGCNGSAPTCAPGQLDGCLAACDQGKNEACRLLGEGLARGQSGGARVGAMFLERACLAGDSAACERLATLPVTRTSASPPASSAARPPAAPQPCPPSIASAIASSSARAGASAAPVASAAPAGSASAPAGSASAPAPAVPVAPAVMPPLPSGASAEMSELVARCARNEGPACTRLGEHFAAGIGVPRSLDSSIEAYAVACERGDAVGCRRAGGALLARRAATPGAVERAVGYFRRGCVTDPGSCSGLGEVAAAGLIPALTPAYGAAQFRGACANNHAPACRRQAATLRDGVGVPRDADAAARIEGRSLDLANQSCQKGVLDDCLLLGLWRERPGVLGEDAGDAARTTDRTSLEGALDAYRKACEGGLPAGCNHAAQMLDALGQPAQAAEARQRLDTTCAAGDAESCAEMLVAFSFAQLAERGAALTKACELTLPRACALLGEAALRAPALGDAGALLERACTLGDPRGCELHLQRLATTAPERLAAAQGLVCERFGGVACVPAARGALASGDRACAARLLARACQEAPYKTATGCAEASVELRATDPTQADELDRAACALAMSGEGLRERGVADACGRSALKVEPPVGLAQADRACEAGSASGCAALSTLLRRQGAADGNATPAASAAAQKACAQGHRGACEQRFGALPTPTAGASARPFAAPDEPGPLSCRQAPGAPSSPLLFAGLAALAAGRRRRSR